MKLYNNQVRFFGPLPLEVGRLAAFLIATVTSVAKVAVHCRQQLESLFAHKPANPGTCDTLTKSNRQVPIIEQILGEIPLAYRPSVLPYLGSSKAIWLGAVEPAFGGIDGRVVTAVDGRQLVLVPAYSADTAQTEYLFVGVIEFAPLRIIRHKANSSA